MATAREVLQFVDTVLECVLKSKGASLRHVFSLIVRMKQLQACVNGNLSEIHVALSTWTSQH